MVGKPGLPGFPIEDKTLLHLHEKEVSGDILACTHCGTLKLPNEQDNHCKNCDNKEWTKTIL
jgi:hypothetical protein